MISSTTSQFYGFTSKSVLSKQPVVDFSDSNQSEERRVFIGRAGLAHENGVLTVKESYPASEPLIFDLRNKSPAGFLKKIVVLAGVKVDLVFLQPACENQDKSVKQLENTESDALELECQRDSQVQCLVVNQTPENNQQIFRATFRLQKNACLKQQILGVSDGKLDYEFDYHLLDQQSNVVLDGVYLSSKKARVQFLTTMSHQSRESTSFQNIRGFASGNSRFHYSGLIHILKDASLCSAKQYNHNILLSEEAWVHTLPQLVIENDDVTCAHGATVGFLDKQQLFYMMSRGLSKETATGMLLAAFLESFFQNIDSEDQRKFLDSSMKDCLQKMFEGS